MHFLTKLLKKIFNRTTVCVIGILLQLTYLVVIFLSFGTQYTYSYFAFVLLGVILSLYIYNMDINPSYKMAWMFAILSFPIFGVMFYVFFGNSHSGDRLRKRMTQYNDEARLLLPQNNELMSALHRDNTAAEKQAKYLYNYGGYPVYANTKTTYFPIGEAKFAAMIEELEKAQRFVFLEYFIVAEGKMWGTILDILERKVKEGVDVRMIYDDIGCLFTLPYKYNEILEEKGIKCRVFNQFRPIWSAKMNNRDHRKILIIDGKTVFTGGINLADEYINRIDRFGHWKDTAVMIQGEAVKSFTLLFLKMWHVAKGKVSIPQEEIRKYTVEVWENTQSDEMRADMESMRNTDMQNTQDKKLHAGGYVIPYGDDPYGDERIGKQVYIDILNRARKYVHIMTPYLILDDEMITALRYCAKRGVETVIIMPHIPDKIYAYLLARTYYKQLLKYGVKIYEYTPGFVHAKVFVSDDIRGCVGTINLDFRSLYLHFECGAYMYSNDVLHDVEQDFKETLKQCQEITKESCDKYPKGKMLVGKMLRLIAPLM